MSGVDTLNVNYSHTQSEFTNGSTSSFIFKIDRATIGWSRVLTPNLSAEVAGGGILLDPGRTTYAANAALIMNFLNNSATLSYSRSTFPSFVGVPTQVIGDVVSLSAVQKLGQQWQLAEAVNYSHGSGESGVNTITFDSYAGSVDLSYWISRIWSAALGYSYINFRRELGTSITEFDRHAVIFSVRADWR